MTPRHYVTLGTPPKQATAATREDRVLKALALGPARIEMLIQRTRMPRTPLDELLKQLLARKLVVRKRVGRRYIWALAKKAVQS